MYSRLVFLQVVGLVMVWNLGFARIDTFYVCKPGEAVSLQVDTSFAGYNWSPATNLDNPTIAAPTASPQQTTLYTVAAITANGDNLIENGDFNEGNTGFSSQYVYSPGANPTQGVYGIFTSGRDLSPQYFANCKDHTTGTGHLMVVDGSPQANQQVWCQTVEVKPNTSYAFSTWVSTILASNPARLQFSINNEPLGIPFSPTLNTCLWRQFYETWFSNDHTEAEICIVNQNTNPNGNDFALDDFSFFELGEVLRDSFLVVVENIQPAVVDTAICSGTFLEYAGEMVPASSSRTFQFTSVRGCDSIVTLQVGVLDTLFEFFRVDTLCPGETFDFFSHTITRDTFLCQTTSQGGTCDTVVCLTAVFLTEAAIDIQAFSPTCHGEADGKISISVAAGLPPYRYQWSDGDNQPFRQGLTSGTYTFEVRDAKDCSAEVAFFLDEPAPLTLGGIGASQFCNGKLEGQIQLEAAGGTPLYQYAVEGKAFQANTLFTGLSPGTYQALVSDGNSCTTEASILIPEPFSPMLVIVAEKDRISLGDSVKAEGLSDAISPLTYQWIPEAGVRCPTCPETEIRALETTHYILVATDPLGCELRADWLLQVDRSTKIYIPNAFSPNGDGVNDTFTIYAGSGIQRILDFSVFDRWGNQLFFRDECAPNDPVCGWDGTFFEQLLMEGIYVYTAKIQLINGVEEYRSGAVLLTR